MQNNLTNYWNHGKWVLIWKYLDGFHRIESFWFPESVSALGQDRAGQGRAGRLQSPVGSLVTPISASYITAQIAPNIHLYA